MSCSGRGRSAAPRRPDPVLVRAFGAPVRFILAATLIAITAAPLPVDAAQGEPPAIASAHPYAAHVTEAARRFGLPEGWIWAVMRAESRGDPRALSPVGAMGLMQIMPATWATLTARYALGSDPYDVRANIHAGAAYLREMLDRYGDLAAALAAYNAGPGRVDEWRSGGRALPAVTRAYVDRIASTAEGSGIAPQDGTPLAPPITWRNAGLFIVRGDGASTATAAAASVQPIGSGPALPHPVSAQPAPVIHSLFVPLSGGGAP
ncbi:MAG: transglycosylase SLT domain-containing protein [Sphingomonadales bacterium]|nr:transglycosylase SLT domain-containing protein [Sphingomonadales bacterium]